MNIRTSVEGKLLAAYLAGLIDGDGSIRIRRRDKTKTIGDRKRGIGFIVLVTIRGEPTHISDLREDCGGIGTVWVRKREGQRLAEWVIAGNQARDLLVIVGPFLQLKYKQAQVAISMPSPRSRWAATPELRHAQECARVQISELNRRGRGKAVRYAN